MKVYQYDQGGFYVGETDDFGEEMPNGCYKEAPSEILDGSPIPINHRYRRLAKGKFELVEDYRGQTGYDITSGKTVEIKSFGPWPGALAKEPKPGPAYEWKGGQWVYNIKLDNPGPAYEFEDEAGVWKKTRFSVFCFLNLFTLEEKSSIKKTISEGNFKMSAVYDAFTTADYVDIRHQSTIENVHHLASEGLISSQRADEILKGQA